MAEDAAAIAASSGRRRSPEPATADEAERSNKQPVLAGMNPNVRDVAKVSNFDRILQIEPDLETVRAKHG